MIDFRLTAQGDVFRVIGTITERADFGPVLAATKHPVSVNFQNTHQVSSAGAMKLRELVIGMPDNGLAFVECPPFLVELFNMIPDLTHMKGHRVQIVSIYVPYMCDTCRISTDVLKEAASIKIVGDQIHLGASPCQKCGNPLTPVIDEQDFLHFLIG